MNGLREGNRAFKIKKLPKDGSNGVTVQPGAVETSWICRTTKPPHQLAPRLQRGQEVAHEVECHNVTMKPMLRQAPNTI